MGRKWAALGLVYIAEFTTIFKGIFMFDFPADVVQCVCAIWGPYGFSFQFLYTFEPHIGRQETNRAREKKKETAALDSSI